MSIEAKIAVQLYTLREDTKTATGFREALIRCKEIGYQAAQLSAVGCMGGDAPEMSATECRVLLDELGMKAVATHRGWDDLATKTDQEIAFHKTIGCDYVALGYLPHTYQDDGLAGYRRWAVEAVGVAREFAEHGIRFGYHNHSFEFQKENGVPLISAFQDADPILQLEVDTYWVHQGGEDPAAFLRSAHGRVPVIHVKDGSPAGVMKAVGEGVLDWDAILAAGESAGTEWYIVEQDECDRDPYDCLASSYRFLAAR
jgi:sugar phosphate isomerase/epimerase